MNKDKDPPKPPDETAILEFSPGGKSLTVNFGNYSDATFSNEEEMIPVSSIMKSSDNNFLPVVDQKTGECTTCKTNPDIKAFCL